MGAVFSRWIRLRLTLGFDTILISWLTLLFCWTCCVYCELLQGCRNTFWWHVWFRTVQVKPLVLTSLWLYLGSCFVSRAVGWAELPSAFPCSLHLRFYPVFSDSIQEQEPQWKCGPVCNAFLQISPLASALWSLIHLLACAVLLCFSLLCFSLLCMSLLSNSSHLADQPYTPLLLMRGRDAKNLQASQSIFCLCAWCRPSMLVSCINSGWLSHIFVFKGWSDWRADYKHLPQLHLIAANPLPTSR